MLPKNSFGNHICEWEIFDTSYAGCLLCGSIHICNYEDCKRNNTVVETEEAMVCTITGLCLRNLVEDNIFTDTCNYQENPHLKSNDRTKMLNTQLPVDNFFATPKGVLSGDKIPSEDKH